MKRIRAIYYRGVFHPKDQVNLPEFSEVEFEPRLIPKRQPSPSEFQGPKTDLTPGRVVIGAAVDAPVLTTEDVSTAIYDE